MATKDSVDDANKRVATEVRKRTRKIRAFPASTFEEALEFAKAILSFGGGQPVRRLSLFDHLEKSPESGPSRQLVTNAGKYSLISGGYQSEFIALTSDGRMAVDDEVGPRERKRAQIRLAIENIDVFNKLFERFSGNKLPAKAALVDAAKEFEIPEDSADEAVETFIINLKFLGLLTTLSGADRIISVEHLLDSLPSSSGAQSLPDGPSTKISFAGQQVVTLDRAQFESTCFYIAPIGDPDSEIRKHSDLFLGSLVEPAVETFGLKIVRADAIDRPGVITKQVLEYIIRSRLVIVDISYHNPNVFYELGIRHMMRLPIVQIARLADKIPFDINQMRTIRIDTTDIYSLVPKLDSYRAEISGQIRRALDDAESTDTPITTYFPNLTVQVG